MIPTYNARKEFLVETLRSVLQQDPGLEEMQIAVIDDGSPAGPPTAVVEEVAGNRVTVYCEPHNLGLAGIWNRCIERARGQWVHILHQDDLVYPGFYAALRTGAVAYPNAGALLCRHAYCDEDGHWRGLSPLERSSPGILTDFLTQLVNGHHVQCAAIVVRRTIYEEIGGFNPALKHALDWERWIRIADRYPILYEPQILAAWRNHSDATTSKQMRTGENIRDIIKAIGIWKADLKDERAMVLSKVALKRFAYEALAGARQFLKLNDPLGCRNQATAALACDRSWAVFKAAVKLLVQARLLSIRGGSLPAQSL